MNYISIEVKIGQSISWKINSQIIDFHENVLKITCIDKLPYNRLGFEATVPITFLTSIHDPENINNLIFDKINEALINSPCDLCLIDFTSNSFFLIREPLLIALFKCITSAIKAGFSNRFIILLPQIPLEKSASRHHLENIYSETCGLDFEILIISNTGDSVVFNKEDSKKTLFLVKYPELFSELNGSPYTRLEKKCVRRLGHFSSYNHNREVKKCRRFSYQLYNCENELRSIFNEWWAIHHDDYTVILYDLKNGLDFRNAIKASAESQGLIYERLIDVFENFEVQDKIKAIGKCILVLDVVESGETLLSYFERLQEIGIKVSKNVLTAINKGGSKDTQHNGFNIHGLIQRDADSQDVPCEQCELDLTFTPDSDEQFIKLRTYDMMYMCKKAGFGPEPMEESPRVGGIKYDLIPNFSKILELFGDWIGFKAFRLIESIHHPADFFILHPDESDSTGFGEKLQVSYDYKLNIIKIPRSIITEFQEKSKLCDNHNQVWTKIIENLNSPDWLIQLQSAFKTHSSALILDIFYASGSTLTVLSSLLEYFPINQFGYICLVDFDPKNINPKVERVSKYSLYDWFNPRQLQN